MMGVLAFFVWRGEQWNLIITSCRGTSRFQHASPSRYYYAKRETDVFLRTKGMRTDILVCWTFLCIIPRKSSTGCAQVTTTAHQTTFIKSIPYTNECERNIGKKMKLNCSFILCWSIPGYDLSWSRSLLLLHILLYVYICCCCWKSLILRDWEKCCCSLLNECILHDNISCLWCCALSPGPKRIKKNTRK